MPHWPDISERIRLALSGRKADDRYRQLPTIDIAADFSSNDYLGLSSSAWLKQRVSELSAKHAMGSTGSRLLSGNSTLAESVEHQLAKYFHSEAALLYNSGYDANVGLLSTVIRPGDVVFYDRAIHASMHQGLKLSGAQCITFQHNAVEDLQQQINENPGDNKAVRWIVLESYYSMDGDIAPLAEIAKLAQKYNCRIIVDEAHALGCFGNGGRGLCHEAGMEESLFARVITFGKALGTHGAAVLCSEEAKAYLVNFSKNFIYTTALPPHSLCSIQAAVEMIDKFGSLQRQLQEKISFFRELTQGQPKCIGTGPVFGWMLANERATKAKATHLQSLGLDVRPIVSPTVPVGTERLRISLHSFNTYESIKQLADALINENGD